MEGRYTVPYTVYGYMPIYEIGSKANVNIPQLVLNVFFAAIVGALAANLSKRAAYWTGGCLAVVRLALLVWVGWSAFQKQMKEKAEYEESVAARSTRHLSYTPAALQPCCPATLQA
jgi:hypothetical protein